MQNLEIELLKYFGHTKFRYDQGKIISAILEGKSVIAVLPTGAGKSLCYQLPALISDNFSIVLSPLIALMKDQVDNLNKNGEVAAFINSTMSFYEAEEVLKKISYGKIKLLYLAPERLDNKSFVDKLSGLNPNFLFVDEAHCISEWGYNFRPSYTKISNFIYYCSITKVSAFTATATPEVVHDITIQLSLKNPVIFVKGFERENLHLNVYTNVKKESKLLELLSITKGPAIIYTSSRKKTEEITDFLNVKGISCGFYHAGLNAIHRRKIQEDFIEDKIRVICATNAFGMGIDKKDIRLIIHYNIPGSIENYYQEIGRAGRDNEDAHIYLLYEEKDVNIQNYFISNSHPTTELISNIYSAICDFNRIAAGSQPDSELILDEEYIASYTSTEISKGMLHSSLKFLENAGYLKQVSELGKKDTVQFLAGSNKIKEFIRRTTNDEIKNSLLILLREFGSEMFSNHKQISIIRLSELLGIPENALQENLTILDILGIISYRPSIKKETVVLTVPRTAKDKLQLNYRKINESFIHSSQKLDNMINYVFTSDCRFKFILNYFGENVHDYKCGKCDNCTTSSQISDSAVEYLSELVINTLSETGASLPEKSVIKIIRGEREKESFSEYTTFGAAANYKIDELKIIVQNMVTKKLLTKTARENNYLELTQLGIEKADESVKQIKVENKYEKDLELYHILREIRKKASEKFLQTQYLLCPDNVLRLVAKEKPDTKAKLMNINSFNNRMFNKIGDDFLEAIKIYNKKNKTGEKQSKLSVSIRETYNLFAKKYTLKEISQIRKLTEAVVSMQLETILEYYPDCEIDHLFEAKAYNKIIQEIKKGYNSLKELKERLPSSVSYAQIRIAVAKYKFSSLA